jgi:DNA polymerase (family 10)
MKNADIAQIFNNIADLLEIKNENPFRIRAYRKAALNIAELGKDVSSLSSEELLEIPGIGHDLEAKIEEYLKTGRVEAYEKLKQEVPESLIELLAIPGLGPKTVSLLYAKFDIKDVASLERLAREHKLSGLPGIKDKTEASILKGIEMVRRYTARHPLGRILPLANGLMKYLVQKAPVGKLELAGSLRRWKETIGDIDIISTSKDPDGVMKVFTHMPGVKQVIAKGPTKSSVLLEDGVQVDIRVVEEDSFGSALAYFTGSKAHNIRLREIASKAGLKINEYGIFREKDNRKLGGRAEEDIYNVLGLQYVPPELREDMGEIEAAAEGRLPHLLEPDDIKGDLHVHSNWSDGSQDLEGLVKTAVEKGYRYVAVTDHSKGLGVARGLSEERIIEQKKMIDALNRKTGRFRILSGAEINIKSDGSLDFDDEMLKQLEVVVASIHSGFRQSSEQITGRIIAAMKNPNVSIIGHPTGRLIGEREAYEVDMEKVLRAAAETGTAIEINAYPLRLDLSEANARRAGALNVPVVISTDAHNSEQFDNMRYGVAVARRGWLEKRDVLNTLECAQFLKRLRSKRT